MKYCMISILITYMMLASYQSCEKEDFADEPTPIIGYDYDQVVMSDYDAITRQYKGSSLYEVDVVTNVPSGVDSYIVFIRTIFQHGDTCIMITHNPEDYEGIPDTTFTVGIWKGCEPINPNERIGWHELINIVHPIQDRINTRYISYRQPTGTGIPMYIFGDCELVVDGLDDEVFWHLYISPSYLSN